MKLVMMSFSTENNTDKKVNISNLIKNPEIALKVCNAILLNIQIELVILEIIFATHVWMILFSSQLEFFKSLMILVFSISGIRVWSAIIVEIGVVENSCCK